jgi:hypothetical protein
MEESGYACAIPSCRATPAELAHIEPWSKVHRHEFDNLIALCPNHHTRFDVERRIPSASIRRYKANLAVLNGRYSTLERRLIEAGRSMPPGAEFPIHIGVRILISNLLEDGLVEEANDFQYQLTGRDLGGIRTTEFYHFTEKGHAFIERWAAAEPLLE